MSEAVLQAGASIDVASVNSPPLGLSPEDVVLMESQLHPYVVHRSSPQSVHEMSMRRLSEFTAASPSPEMSSSWSPNCVQM